LTASSCVQIRNATGSFLRDQLRGRTYSRDIVIVEVISEGLSGWGRNHGGREPFYNEEWTDSAWLIARDYVAPHITAKN